MKMCMFSVAKCPTEHLAGGLIFCFSRCLSRLVSRFFEWPLMMLVSAVAAVATPSSWQPKIPSGNLTKKRANCFFPLPESLTPDDHEINWILLPFHEKTSFHPILPTETSLYPTVWVVRLCKRCCSLFSCLLGQHSSCSTAQRPVELSENILQDQTVSPFELGINSPFLSCFFF